MTSSDKENVYHAKKHTSNVMSIEFIGLKGIIFFEIPIGISQESA